MAWIIVEGIDRSGKSSVAEMYKQDGYEVFHMEAPDEKYREPGYTGPSYLDECMDIYMHLDGKDVIFDRSPYGELVWPDVYGRKNQLSSEDIEILRELETSNNARYIHMSDPDYEAHWQRCVDNKEPLNRSQFNAAVALYDKLEKRFSFERKQLSDFKDLSKSTLKEVEPLKTETKPVEKKSIHQLKLEEANAINTLLLARIVKKKGEAFDKLEGSIRSHLQDKLAGIFSGNSKNTLTDEEIFIFKKYVDKLKQTMEK